MAPAADAASPSPRPEPHWRAQSRGARWLLVFALLVSLLVAAGVPLGYFWLTRQAEQRESVVAARLHAAFLTQVVVRSGGDWRRDIEGLIEADLAPGVLPERRSVLDADGRVVSTSGPAVPGPLLVRRAALLGTQGPVGEVRVERSLRPVLQATGLVALGALALAAVIFSALYHLPLRALRRTIEALRQEETEARAREEAEAHLQAIFQNAVEGILMFDAQGRIVASNPAARRLLGGHDGCVLEGQAVTRWFEPREGQFDSEGVDPAGAAVPIEITVASSGAAGGRRQVAILRDVSERRRQERRLMQLAHHDGLTGLPNRRSFEEELHEAVQQARGSPSGFALMFLDLDRFKAVNDTLGHQAGDELLQQVAQRLQACLRHGDAVALRAPPHSQGTVYRLAGDEFTVLLRGVTGPASALPVARRIVEALSAPVALAAQTVQVSTSVGIALYPADGTDAATLIQRADAAMYQAKAGGRNRFCFFSEALPQHGPAHGKTEEAAAGP